MWQTLRRSPGSFVAALLLHLTLAGLTLVGLDWLSGGPDRLARPQVVQARIVDAAALQAEVDRLEQIEEERRVREEARARAEEERRAAEEAKRLAEQERRQEAEASRKAKAEAQARRAAEERRRAEEEAARVAEERRKAEEQAQREAAKRRAEEEAQRQAAEERRRVEEEAARVAEERRKAEEQAQREVAAKRRAEEEAQRQREAAEAAQRAREEELLAALEAEQQATELAATEIDLYAAAIDEQIRRYWVRPAGSRRDLVSTVEVRLIPGGEVVPGSVRVVRSSGDPAYDRSVVAAVYKASPLPVPSGRLFERFRDAKLRFKADN
jgi:colicin import membrane protein